MENRQDDENSTTWKRLPMITWGPKGKTTSTPDWEPKNLFCIFSGSKPYHKNLPFFSVFFGVGGGGSELQCWVLLQSSLNEGARSGFLGSRPPKGNRNQPSGTRLEWSTSSFSLDQPVAEGRLVETGDLRSGSWFGLRGGFGFPWVRHPVGLDWLWLWDLKPTPNFDAN